jgi:hypothetical protein
MLTVRGETAGGLTLRPRPVEHVDQAEAVTRQNAFVSLELGTKNILHMRFVSVVRLQTLTVGTVLHCVGGPDLVNDCLTAMHVR